MCLWIHFVFVFLFDLEFRFWIVLTCLRHDTPRSFFLLEAYFQQKHYFCIKAINSSLLLEFQAGACQQPLIQWNLKGSANAHSNLGFVCSGPIQTHCLPVCSSVFRCALWYCSIYLFFTFFSNAICIPETDLIWKPNMTEPIFYISHCIDMHAWQGASETCYSMISAFLLCWPLCEFASETAFAWWYRSIIRILHCYVL